MSSGSVLDLVWVRNQFQNWFRFSVSSRISMSSGSVPGSVCVRYWFQVYFGFVVGVRTSMSTVSGTGMSSGSVICLAWVRN